MEAAMFSDKKGTAELNVTINYKNEHVKMMHDWLLHQLNSILHS